MIAADPRLEQDEPPDDDTPTRAEVERDEWDETRCHCGRRASSTGLCGKHMAPTLASTFAAIVNAPLPTQDRNDLARFLLRTQLIETTGIELERAISRVMTADLAATSKWYDTHDRTILARD